MKRRPYTYLEALEQRLFIKRFRLDPRTRGCLACAVPNGGRRDKVTAVKLKAEGVERGVPDWLLFEHGKDGAVGLALEFKSPTGRGKSTPEQKAWQKRLEALGWRVRIVLSAQEAWVTTLRHLGIGLDALDYSHSPRSTHDG